MSVPVIALTFLGFLIALLGLFAAGNVILIAVGLAAIGFAGLLQVLGTRKG
jgi:hypothetical protein